MKVRVIPHFDFFSLKNKKQGAANDGILKKAINDLSLST